MKQVGRPIQRVPTEQIKLKTDRFELGTIKANGKARYELSDLTVLETVPALQIFVSTRNLSEDQTKSLDISDEETRLRNGAPQLTVECLQNEEIEAQRPTPGRRQCHD